MLGSVIHHNRDIFWVSDWFITFSDANEAHCGPVTRSAGVLVTVSRSESGKGPGQVQAAGLSQAMWTGGVFYLILCAALMLKSESGTSSDCTVPLVIVPGDSVGRRAWRKEAGSRPPQQRPSSRTIFLTQPQQAQTTSCRWAEFQSLTDEQT